MTSLDDDLLELSMQHAAATPADTTALRDALWRRLHAEGWKAAPHTRRAFGSPTSDDDRTLLEAFVRGDPDAYNALYRRHAGALLGAAQRWLAKAEAQDAVQDAYIALYRKAQQVLDNPNPNGVRAFLFGATRIKMLDYHRRRLRAEQVLEAYAAELSTTGPDLFEQLLQRERTQLVADLFTKCNPLEQAVVSMALAGHTNTEIAKALELEPGHVGVLKHRAHAKLTNAIAEEGEP